MHLDGRHHRTGEAVRVSAAGGVVTAVESIPDLPGLPTLAPGFFDPQINGALGVNFNDPKLTEDGVRAVVAACRAHGVAAFAPTLVTGPFAALAHGFRTLAGLVDLVDAMPVYHLEGPYLSPEDGPRGAHPREHVRPPDAAEFDRWQDAAQGRIRLVTLAPEVLGALPFIEKLVKEGVVVAIGHTAATAAQIADAASAGATVSTHLGNGLAATIDRHANPLWPQLADNRLTAGVIADGDHLPATVFECIRRVKGIARLFVTCDASPLAGLPAGRYDLWGSMFEVTPTGRVVVPGTPYLAGSGHFTDHCFATLVNRLNVTVADALTLTTVTARKLLRLPVPTLDAGQPAALLAIDDTPAGVRARPATDARGQK
jgi:N-acetylglucosamine-6-phosphate deacetylase